MAVRPVFIPRSSVPYLSTWNAEFVYNSGFAVSQKQKNITAIHRTFLNHFPGSKILEISSKSMQDGGVELSAFNLMKFVPSLGKSVRVENIYQAGKVFKNGGPYTDLLEVSPKDAKRDERLKTSGPLIGFRFEGHNFPLVPHTCFYDYLYINALLENEDLAKIVLEYDAFTDVEFNPEKSLNCQAKSAAMFVSLSRLGMTEKARDPEEFLRILRTAPIAPAVSAKQPEEKEEDKPSLVQGVRIRHKVWGEGVVTEVSGTIAAIGFPDVGIKKLGIEWVLKNCEIL